MLEHRLVVSDYTNGKVDIWKWDKSEIDDESIQEFISDQYDKCSIEWIIVKGQECINYK